MFVEDIDLEAELASGQHVDGTAASYGCYYTKFADFLHWYQESEARDSDQYPIIVNTR
jgi:hypothetical protein